MLSLATEIIRYDGSSRRHEVTKNAAIHRRRAATPVGETGFVMYSRNA
jgi:hypothetical protein